MELPTTSLPLVFWLFPTMLPQSVLVFKTKKRLKTRQESTKDLILKILGSFKGSNEYCYFRPMQSLQIPHFSNHFHFQFWHCSTLHCFCEILFSSSLSLTCISPPVPHCHRPPHKLEQNVTFPQRHHLGPTMCHVKDATLRTLTIFTFLWQLHKTPTTGRLSERDLGCQQKWRSKKNNI